MAQISPTGKKILKCLITEIFTKKTKWFKTLCKGQANSRISASQSLWQKNTEMIIQGKTGGVAIYTGPTLHKYK